jgi:hypothetical protein
LAVYVHFGAGSDKDLPRSLTGVITEARTVRDRGVLEPHEQEWLEQIFEWYNDHLPCPLFSRKRWSGDAISWFKDDAGDFIKRILDIVAQLKEHGVPVRILRTDKPGMILYEDEFQVVAESPHW